MSLKSPILHLICGKIASGKSTLAAKLSTAEGAILLSEDQWLKALFFDQMATGADYSRCSTRLRAIMGLHISRLLNIGVSVVLDFPANTVEQRTWMLGIIRETGADHQLHVLDVPDDICMERLRRRNAQGEHAFAPTEEQYHQFSKHFALPLPDEGFNVLTHREVG